MNRQNIYAILLASTTSATGYFLGYKEKENPKWFPKLMKKAMADSAAGTLILQPGTPTIPKGPIQIEINQKDEKEIEFWKRPSRAAEIMRFGYPGFDNLRTFEDFIVSYDRRNRTPHWVMEHLTPERIAYNPEVDRSKCIFQPDNSIHPYFRSQNEDYRRSGYDRGHLAAAANHRRTQLAMEQTFLLSNMSPQVGKGFNRDKWNELEKYVRHLARENLNIYICSGPLYLPHQEEDGNLYIKYKVIGKSQVAVPTHFFKVILIEKNKDQFELEAYLMPNASIPDENPLHDFLVPLDSIERSAGFLLFDKLPKEKLKMVNGKMEEGKEGGLFGLF